MVAVRAAPRLALTIHCLKDFESLIIKYADERRVLLLLLLFSQLFIINFLLFLSLLLLAFCTLRIIVILATFFRISSQLLRLLLTFIIFSELKIGIVVDSCSCIFQSNGFGLGVLVLVGTVLIGVFYQFTGRIVRRVLDLTLNILYIHVAVAFVCVVLLRKMHTMVTTYTPLYLHRGEGGVTQLVQRLLPHLIQLIHFCDGLHQAV